MIARNHVGPAREPECGQRPRLLVDLNDAFLEGRRAKTRFRVVILGATGPLFSSGHEMARRRATGKRCTPAGEPHTSSAVNQRRPRDWAPEKNRILAARSGTTSNETHPSAGATWRKDHDRRRSSTVYGRRIHAMWACDPGSSPL